MFATLNTLALTFWSICLFRLGPQDLPASRTFTSVTLFSLCVTYVIALLLDEHSPANALLFSLTHLTLLIFLVTSLLFTVRLSDRIDQTLTAFAGTGVILLLLNILIIILALQFKIWDWDTSLFAIVLLGLFVWGILIDAHILRHALSSSFGLGLAMAFLLNLIMIIILAGLFPSGAELSE